MTSDRVVGVDGGGEVEAGAAGGDWRGDVEVGESQSAGEGLSREEGEEGDEDEAEEQGEGGSEYVGFQQKSAILGVVP